MIIDNDDDGVRSGRRAYGGPTDGVRRSLTGPPAHPPSPLPPLLPLPRCGCLWSFMGERALRIVQHVQGGKIIIIINHSSLAILKHGNDAKSVHIFSIAGEAVLKKGIFGTLMGLLKAAVQTGLTPCESCEKKKMRA